MSHNLVAGTLKRGVLDERQALEQRELCTLMTEAREPGCLRGRSLQKNAGNWLHRIRRRDGGLSFHLMMEGEMTVPERLGLGSQLRKKPQRLGPKRRWPKSTPTSQIASFLLHKHSIICLEIEAELGCNVRHTGLAAVLSSKKQQPLLS